MGGLKLKKKWYMSSDFCTLSVTLLLLCFLLEKHCDILKEKGYSCPNFSAQTLVPLIFFH